MGFLPQNVVAKWNTGGRVGLAYAVAALLAWGLVAARSLRLFLQEPPAERR